MFCPPPPIQYALLHSVGAASLLFALLQISKKVDIKTKSGYMPGFLVITLGKSSLFGVFYLTATWLLTSFYIFLFPSFCHGCVYFEIFLWTLGFVGSLYATISIFKFLITGYFVATSDVD